MPEIWGVRLTGELPAWVSAKDVILELLRRHGVAGGVGRVIEYHGPGLAGLSVWDRHVIANMGAELGATTSVFPSDEVTRRFLESVGRGEDWRSIAADEPRFDVDEEIDLGRLEPMIAAPSSPGRVMPVREAAGRPIYQGYIGSSANPGFRDFAIAAEIVAEGGVADGVSFDVNPTSRVVLQQLIDSGHLGKLLAAGARLHQVGCNGCIGMGQAPATGRNSIRTVPRNFPGRSGTREDRVWLASPETVAASVCKGHVSDPRSGREAPAIEVPPGPAEISELSLRRPLPKAEARSVEIEKGPNIVALPELDPLPSCLDLSVLLVLGDDVSTDEILPAGARVLPLRSNLPAIARHVFEAIDDGYVDRALDSPGDGHAIVAGRNYGQGSSREHAAAAPRELGLRLVIARGFARIHHQNLVNFGVVPLSCEDDDVRAGLRQGSRVTIANLREQIQSDSAVELSIDGRKVSGLRSDLSRRQAEVLLAGGLVPWIRAQAHAEA